MTTWQKTSMKWQTKLLVLTLALTLPFSAVAAPEAEADPPVAEAGAEGPPLGRVLKAGAVVIPEPSAAIIDFLKIQPDVKSLLMNSTHFLHTREHEEFFRNMVKENADLTTEVHVAAVFANGRLDLHPDGVDPARPPLVTREVVDGEMIWHYGPFRVAMRRIDGATGE